MSWNDKENKEFKHKTIRVILASSNRPDGRYVIISIDKGPDNDVNERIGMTLDEAKTYNLDKVLGAANSLAPHLWLLS